MARYSRARARSGRSGSYRRSSTARRSRAYRRRSGRVGSRVRSRNSAARTVRIVIEQPRANPVARPEIGVTEARPRKAVF